MNPPETKNLPKTAESRVSDVDENFSPLTRAQRSGSHFPIESGVRFFLLLALTLVTNKPVLISTRPPPSSVGAVSDGPPKSS
ncbi:hypothetical protein LMH87_003553 [Akanthomyces muscarius]|uniref:Uncharacterized protein n=1 Tax=Akanthomyces muscarius TaxID=2231603 RepID=A0A9W8Q252_AKAMU|nr:hypothetical protein LMH87_003553 [Akanthomyces muscarius]KAJ4144679.1 hypothetical protein LMH87_003553 [Akanthomyces muscarius]